MPLKKAKDDEKRTRHVPPMRDAKAVSWLMQKD